MRMRIDELEESSRVNVVKQASILSNTWLQTTFKTTINNINTHEVNNTYWI